jgi:hypothetical protein
MRKICLILSVCLSAAGFSFAQQNYLAFDGSNIIEIGYRDGKVDSLSANPKVNKVFNGTKCIKYARSIEKFDNIKIHPNGLLEDVSGFATFHESAQKIKMKVYSTAPVGTMIELQLTKKGVDNYPKGVHSQFQAKTKKQNEWEEIEFVFVNYPEGSQVSPKEIDEVVILFSPNSAKTATFYFSDLIGPKLILEPSAVKTSN